MNDSLAVYRIWAPDYAVWTDWAKPVLFTSLPFPNGYELNLPEIKYLQSVDYSTAVIVDLPAERSVEEGLSLAKLGYRPVPLYNGVQSKENYPAAAEVGGIIKAMHKGTELLSSTYVKFDAPPAFMLDSNRMEGRGKQPGIYDNRWCAFPQDMPSAAFLTKNGIRQIIIRSDKIRDDLSHILLRYKNQGVKVLLCKDGEIPKDITIMEPPMFMSFFYRFSVILGLKRNAAGGFGALIPEPQSSSG